MDQTRPTQTPSVSNSPSYLVNPGVIGTSTASQPNVNATVHTPNAMPSYSPTPTSNLSSASQPMNPSSNVSGSSGNTGRKKRLFILLGLALGVILIGSAALYAFQLMTPEPAPVLRQPVATPSQFVPGTGTSSAPTASPDSPSDAMTGETMELDEAPGQDSPYATPFEYVFDENTAVQRPTEQEADPVTPGEVQNNPFGNESAAPPIGQ